MTACPPITNTLLSTRGKFKESTNNIGISNKIFLNSIKVFKSSRIFLVE